MLSRIILLIIWSFLWPLWSSAQWTIIPQKQLLLYGQIKDSITDKPISFANVEVFRNEKETLARAANDAGRFEVKVDSAYIIKLRISAIGYTEKWLELMERSNNQKPIDLGTIFIVPGNRLEIVDITKRPPVIQNMVDKIVYHVANEPSLSGGTGEDVFRKLPMVSLGPDGKVALRGNQQVKILINGKPSAIFTGNSADALRMFPSDQIKSVEIMTNPSVKYDMEGAAGIINIITNKRLVDGLNGGVVSSVETRRSNIAGNIAGRMGNFGLTASIGSSWSYPIASVIRSERLSAFGEAIFSQVNQSRNRRNGRQLALAMDYELDSNNLLVSNLNFNKLTVITDNHIESTYPSENSVILGAVDNKQPASNLDMSIDYVRKLGAPGKELLLSTQYAKGNNGLAYRSDYNSRREVGNNQGSSHEYTAQLDLKYPVGAIAMDFGVKMVKRNVNALIAIDSLDRLANRMVADAQRSYLFKYRQDILAGYVAAVLPIGELFNLSAGLRWERTNWGGAETNGVSKFSNRSTDLFPNLAFSYTYGKKTAFKIAYGKRIQRPSLYYLNPFKNNTDGANQIQGNPNLRSEIMHQLGIGGDFNFNRNNGHVGLSIYYKTINHMIEQVFQHRFENNRTMTLQTFGNIGSNKSLGTSIYGSFTLFKRIDFKGNIDLYTYSNNLDNDFLNTSLTKDRVYLLYKTFVGIMVAAGKGFIIDSNIFWDSPQRTFQGEFAAFNLWNITVKKKLLKETATIGITMTDPFNKIKNLSSYAQTSSMMQKSNFSLPFRSFGLSLSWQFGKGKYGSYRSKEKQINNDDQKL
ncbi:TonB-dependent receptor [Sphingobacterium puteale]|uniref:TonB-dependent receptor n=1 Tax=Sphingobacterium puteale TaxID=2420510 RepID=A0A420VWG9_9SPHI|nr:outer membrane beta-barrel family protein [Sphingobacterium puteale]RKO70703.1 TonB-dependent receptor [Sphingobacterium puteale]